MRKRILIIAALMAFIATANAQVFMGGSFGFTSTKYGDQSGTSFKIIPDVGYQLDDDLAIGIQIGYSHGYASFGSLTVTDIKSTLSTIVSASADLNSDDMKLNSFTIQPYARYNVVNFGKANLFLEGYIGYTSISTDETPTTTGGTTPNETTLSAFEIGVRPGISIGVSDKLDVICKLGSVGYISAKEKDSDDSITRFGIAADTYNLLFGVNFKF